MEHLGDVLEDAAASTFASHFADGTAPVDVDEIGLLLFDYFEALEEFAFVGTEDLDAEGALGRGEAHLAVGLFGFAVEGLRGNELSD